MNREEKIKELWRQASDCYQKARQEFDKGEYEKATELAWSAVNAATTALCLKFLDRETPGTAPDFVREALVKAGLSELDVVNMLLAYRGAREMQGAVLYGGRYDPEFHDPIILREIPEYLCKIGRVLGMEVSGLKVGMSERGETGVAQATPITLKGEISDERAKGP
jgi:hypothetical protein